jgi:hypothetical protein
MAAREEKIEKEMAARRTNAFANQLPVLPDRVICIFPLADGRHLVFFSSTHYSHLLFSAYTLRKGGHCYAN